MSIETTGIGQNNTDYQGLVTKWQEESDLFTRQGLAGDEIWVTCADELAEVIARNVQPSPDDQKIESMTFATEPCPDCGSRHHRSCEARPVQQPAPNKFASGREVVESEQNKTGDVPTGACSNPPSLRNEPLAISVQQPATEPDGGETLRHGINCEKRPHLGCEGYLHDESDDSPYDVDGVNYCGRCHWYLPAPSPQPSAEATERCHAQKDGDCNWKDCPQEANNRANYQSTCPLACLCEEDDGDNPNCPTHRPAPSGETLGKCPQDAIPHTKAKHEATCNSISRVWKPLAPEATRKEPRICAECNQPESMHSKGREQWCPAQFQKPKYKYRPMAFIPVAPGEAVGRETREQRFEKLSKQYGWERYERADISELLDFAESTLRRTS